MTRMVQCVRLNAQAEGLDFAPFLELWDKKFMKMSPKRVGRNGLSIKRC